mgnify:FL=1|tara:strand:- start:745 stop:1365 length:621 start_codon:yes stop_codon:yes gene_type:complete
MLNNKIKYLLSSIIVFLLIVGLAYTPYTDYILDRSSNTYYATPVYGYKPLDYSLTFYGLKEMGGDNNGNSIIVNMANGLVDWYTDSREIPWCSLYMNYIYSSCGYEYSGSLLARSWLTVGDTISYKDVMPGDVVILWRGSKTSTKGHVGQFIRFNEKDKTVGLLGGNQGNKVGINFYPSHRILGIRRIKKSVSIRNELFTLDLKNI